MKPFWAALQFLTILPVNSAFSERDREQAPYWFPLIGLTIGLVVVAVDGAWARLGLPIVVQSVLSVGLLAALTGGLHLDGLADTADGFLSARPRERVLEIMRDSHIGAMGVLALVFILSLKAAALISLTGPTRWQALVLAPLGGRCLQLVVMSLLPYARRDGGLASAYIRRRRPGLAVWAVLWLTAGAILMAGPAKGMGATAAALLGAGLLAVWQWRRIRGFTGDTLGATSEIVETLLLVVFCGLPGMPT